MNNESELWLTDELWDSIDDESANFAFEQGEKYMLELQEVAKSITNRSYMMLSVVVAVCPLLITTSITTNNLVLSTISYLFTAFCVGLSIFITGLVKPRGGFSIGRDPKSLLRLCDMQHHKQTNSCIKLYELENLQNKIEMLEQDNNIRAKQQTVALYSIVIALSICLIVASF